jgi:exoribonuclease R
VDAAASKWEILIHITDVSDIYSPDPLIEDPSDYLALLRKAAESRGTSRYDLPLGPLHLLPPVALKALALSDRKEYQEGNNRCVTLWVYIDERNGRILDVGLERTVISSPIKLTFAKAVIYLDESVKTDLDVGGTKARAILQVAERNLSLWSDARRENSEFARKREARLSAREEEAMQMRPRGHVTGDDGRNGFVRTRGHRLVDSALDLYAYGTARLLQVSKAPVPRTAGADASRGGRVATAPLRRYIDGVAQRQALAILCKYGGSPLSLTECIEAGKAATEAKNSITNISAMRRD